MQPQKIESGVQLFSRIKHSSNNFCISNINPKLFPEGAPSPNDIIEVTGDFHKNLLLDFIIRCILPKELNENWRGTGVVFINTTHHISVLKITTVINAHLKHLNIPNGKTIIEKALSNITMLNCYNNEQIEITFRNLDRTIQDRENVNLLIVDDITSQFCIAKQHDAEISFNQYSKEILQLLRSQVKNLNIITIFSRCQLDNLKRTTDLHTDYKIIGEQLETNKGQFLVIDYIKKTTRKAPFQLEKFINFT